MRRGPGPGGALARIVALGLVVSVGRLAWAALQAPAPLVVDVAADATDVAVQRAVDEARMLALADTLGWARTDPILSRHLAAGARWVDPDLGDVGQAADAARAWGLDVHDPLVRERLLHRVDAVLSAPATAPDTATLEAWRADHGDRFARPAPVTFEHRVVLARLHGDDLDATVARVQAALEAGEAVAGDPLPGLRPTDRQTRTRVASLWGGAVADALADAPVGVWVTVPTARGVDLVRVVARPDPVVPALDAIRAEVQMDWSRSTAPARRRARLDDLAARWPVTVVRR
ncbi:MAG: peptidyl-prolyl cis-trans isomerase [Alphaproteobacteria bacterium]|nr:peptidyl-prolyl cis-trans isomerase [Alphaproteobacteria bacterium]